jgi:hypothetical protein
MDRSERHQVLDPLAQRRAFAARSFQASAIWMNVRRCSSVFAFRAHPMHVLANRQYSSWVNIVPHGLRPVPALSLPEPQRRFLISVNLRSIGVWRSSLADASAPAHVQVSGFTALDPKSRPRGRSSFPDTRHRLRVGLIDLGAESIAHLGDFGSWPCTAHPPHGCVDVGYQWHNGPVLHVPSLAARAPTRTSGGGPVSILDADQISQASPL